jgi:hypothetical protein
MIYPLASLDINLRVRLVDAYGDGTVWASIEDGQGRTTRICIDGRKSSVTRNRLFERAKHPSDPDCVIVELVAPEEGLVVALISEWLDSNDGLEGLTERGRVIVREALLRLGDVP